MATKDKTTADDTAPVVLPEPDLVAEVATPDLVETVAELAAWAHPTCETCRGELVPYTGNNPLKFGTAFCTACGLRTPYRG